MEDMPRTTPLYTRVLGAGLSGTVLVLGGTDSGKTTLVRVLWQELGKHLEAIALLDTDPGQGFTGPPSTLTLTVRKQCSAGVTLARRRYFIGNTSPRGHMLPMLAGTARLHQEACKQNVPLLLVDTCGFVSWEGGGVVLKNHKIECLRPSWILALQKEDELEPILRAWEGLESMRVMRLRVPDTVRIKTSAERRTRRNDRFQRYFAHASVVSLSLQRRRRFFYHSLQRGRLLGLLDEQDFLLSLGILLAWHPTRQVMEIRTPFEDIERVSAIRTGRLLLNPLTGEEVIPMAALRRKEGVQEQPSASEQSRHETTD